jgi:hypothetical protein
MPSTNYHEIAEFNRGTITDLTNFLSARGINETIPRNVVRFGSQSPQDLIDAIVENEKITLKGEPGIGKSISTVSSLIDAIQGGVPQMRTAFFVPLHLLNDSNFGYDSPQLIEKVLTEHSRAKELRDGFVKDRLGASDTAILFDGLDELYSPEKRTNFDSWLKSVMETYNGPKYIMVSSRPWIETKNIDKEFVKYQFEPLTDKEVFRLFEEETRAINESYIGTTGQPVGKVVRDNLEAFRFRRGNADYKDVLLRNPFYIRMAALLDGIVPQGSAGFIESGIKQYLSAAKFKKQQAGILEKRYDGRVCAVTNMIGEAPLLLQKIAFELHSSGRRSMPLSEIVNIKWPAIQWVNITQDNQKRVEPTPEEKRDIISAIAQVAPYFAESHKKNGEPNYYFTHLGIQEYLVAKELVNEICEKREELVQNMVNRSWWRMPLVYCVGAASVDFVRDTVFENIAKTGKTDFMADAYLFGKDGSMDPKLREKFKRAYSEFYIK